MANLTSLDETKALLRVRFHQLMDERDKILAASAPLRAERDAIMAEAEIIIQKAKPLETRYAEIEAPLGEVMKEITAINNVLGGKTGERNS
jgi:uncharacterized coiled-coil DUF342 family protein